LLPFKKTKYNLAIDIFNAQSVFGGFCSKCQSLKYFSFKTGSSYLTAQPANLVFVNNPSGSPNANQLFEGIQNADETWSFKANNGKYIRADPNLSSIKYNNIIGLNERWYIERHGNHVHIQSGIYYQYYWANSGSLLTNLNGGASMYVV
jgi:hypothetical protein